MRLNRRPFPSRNSRGFTLIEVLIVIFIVLALGGLVAYNLLGKKEKADADLGKIELNNLKSALKQFRFVHGRFPTDEEGLSVLWNKDNLTDEEAQKKWEKLFEAPMPKDRWGSEWGYRQLSEHGDESTYDLWSYGPDKQEGTADDIVSWNVEDEAGGTDSGTTSGSSSSGTGGG